MVSVLLDECHGDLGHVHAVKRENGVALRCMYLQYMECNE